VLEGERDQGVQLSGVQARASHAAAKDNGLLDLGDVRSLCGEGVHDVCVWRTLQLYHWLCGQISARRAPYHMGRTVRHTSFAPCLALASCLFCAPSVVDLALGAGGLRDNLPGWILNSGQRAHTGHTAARPMAIIHTRHTAGRPVTGIHARHTAARPMARPAIFTISFHATALDGSAWVTRRSDLFDCEGFCRGRQDIKRRLRAKDDLLRHSGLVPLCGLPFFLLCICIG